MGWMAAGDSIYVLEVRCSMSVYANRGRLLCSSDTSRVYNKQLSLLTGFSGIDGLIV